MMRAYPAGCLKELENRRGDVNEGELNKLKERALRDTGYPITGVVTKDGNEPIETFMQKVKADGGIGRAASDLMSDMIKAGKLDELIRPPMRRHYNLSEAAVRAFAKSIEGLQIMMRDGEITGTVINPRVTADGKVMATIKLLDGDIHDVCFGKLRCGEISQPDEPDADEPIEVTAK
jgi:hypothetical protein